MIGVAAKTKRMALGMLAKTKLFIANSLAGKPSLLLKKSEAISVGKMNKPKKTIVPKTEAYIIAIKMLSLTRP